MDERDYIAMNKDIKDNIASKTSWVESPLLTRLIIILETRKILDGCKDTTYAHEWAVDMAIRIMEEI